MSHLAALGSALLLICMGNSIAQLGYLGIQCLYILLQTRALHLLLLLVLGLGLVISAVRSEKGPRV